MQNPSWHLKPNYIVDSMKGPVVERTLDRRSKFEFIAT